MITPRTANIADDIGDLLIRQLAGKKRHRERCRLVISHSHFLAGDDDVNDRVGLLETNRRCTIEWREDVSNTLAIGHMTAGAVVMSSDDDAGNKPSIPYWHLYVGDSGVSHQHQCHLTDYTLSSVGPADPQRNNKEATVPSTVVFTVQPVGWVGDWHEPPAPQWIVVLSGSWFIESMDGTRIEQGPGEFSFGEDQGCTESDGKKGHRSGTLGDQPAVLMTVQLHRPPQRQPCHIK